MSIPKTQENVDKETTSSVNNSPQEPEENPAKSKPTYQDFYDQILKRSMSRKSDRRTLAEKQIAVAQLALSMSKAPEIPPSKTRGEGYIRQYVMRMYPEEKNPPVWHKFSKSLASELNPKQPDITGALVLYGLALWMKVAKKRKLDYCYRSLSELATEYPYLSESGIEKALKRLHAKLKPDFRIVPDGKTYRFSVSDKLIKRLDTDKKCMFRIALAKDYGVTESLLLGNLTWQLAPTKEEAAVHRPTTAIPDADGVPYFPLSPTTLTKPDYETRVPIFPMSPDTVTRALTNLVKMKNILVPHPSVKSYYTLKSAFDEIKGPQLSTNVEQDAAERDSNGAERDSRAAERDDLPCVDSNNIVNENSKVFTPHTVPASPPLCGEQASPGLLFLLRKGQEALHKVTGHSAKVATVPASQLPYDLIRSPQLDLPYDYIPTHPWTKRVYLHSHRVRDWMEDIVEGWRLSKFKYSKKDTAALTKLFLSVPSFTLEHFVEVERHYDFDIGALFGGGSRKPPRTGEWDPWHFARKVKNASSLMRYLPELIEEMHTEVYEFDGEWQKSPCMEKPFEYVLEYFRPISIEKEYIHHECNPIMAAA